MGVWDAAIAALATASDEQWHALVSPLAEMTKLTYTATYGSYFAPADLNASVSGWERDLALRAAGESPLPPDLVSKIVTRAAQQNPPSTL